jgi:lysophospholipase L1-like esterase
MRTLKLLAVLALALPLATSCYTDEQLGAAPLPNTGELMRRYVSMGNSSTAGFQSAGINDSTQNLAYPVLFAGAVGTGFAVPSLNMPGCPAPFINNLTMERVPPPIPTGCALRAHEPLPPFFSNLAVPVAHVIDLLDNLDAESNANTLTMLILGGKTQVKAMTDANPTFVSVWIGSNDVLGALTSSTDPGDPSQITSQADFEASYGAVLNAIEATPASGALISVGDPTLLPFASLGATYWCLKTGACPGVPIAPFPAIFTVDISCSPSVAGAGGQGESILVPWTVGIVQILTAAQGLPQTLDCTDDAQVALPSEVAAMQAATAGYNTYIAAQAASRGFAYYDINPDLIAANVSGEIPPFPNIPPDAPLSPVTFGPLFSLDGVHPSSESHRRVADSLISTVNQTFGTTIPLLP